MKQYLLSLLLLAPGFASADVQMNLAIEVDGQRHAKSFVFAQDEVWTETYRHEDGTEVTVTLTEDAANEEAPAAFEVVVKDGSGNELSRAITHRAWGEEGSVSCPATNVVDARLTFQAVRV